MDKLIFDLSEYDSDTIMALLSADDNNLKMVSQFYNTKLDYHGDGIYTDDDTNKEKLQKVFQSLIDIYYNTKSIEQQDVVTVLNNNFFKKYVVTGAGNKKYYLRTAGQGTLYNAFENNVVTFAIGPAGTGKTFLACIYSYKLLKEGLVKKIIVTRPVVEAGESLGFLPGDLKDKIDPYLRPIYDSFELLVGKENLDKMVERGIIEIAPLAYMRGRTLSDACVILDEAQNTTPMQLKMFITRLGFNSKMIITGDLSQIDLPANKPSGLLRATKILEGIDDIAIIRMNNYDVVRHPLVSKIISAYEKNEG